MQIQTDKTLEELENNIWTNTEFPTGLVRKYHFLRKKKLRDFSVEDLRLMLSQDIGAKYLVPVAIKILKTDILAEGDFYPGDLLESILNLPVDFWIYNKTLLDDLGNLIEERFELIKSANLGDTIKEDLLISINKFQKI